jgi:hypothetical protein
MKSPWLFYLFLVPLAVAACGEAPSASSSSHSKSNTSLLSDGMDIAGYIRAHGVEDPYEDNYLELATQGFFINLPRGHEARCGFGCYRGDNETFVIRGIFIVDGCFECTNKTRAIVKASFSWGNYKTPTTSFRYIFEQLTSTSYLAQAADINVTSFENDGRIKEATYTTTVNHLSSELGSDPGSAWFEYAKTTFNMTIEHFFDSDDSLFTGLC